MVAKKKKLNTEEFCFVVVELIFGHPCFYVVCTELFFVRLVTCLRGVDFWSCVSSAKKKEEKKMYRVVSS